MMPTEIKFTSGDVVFWLSSTGFQKGIVKQVILTDQISMSEDLTSKRTKRKEIQFRLWHEGCSAAYCGDLVAVNEIFSTYSDMVAYYDKKGVAEGVSKV